MYAHLSLATKLVRSCEIEIQRRTLSALRSFARNNARQIRASIHDIAYGVENPIFAAQTSEDAFVDVVMLFSLAFFRETRPIKSLVFFALIRLCSPRRINLLASTSRCSRTAFIFSFIFSLKTF